MAIFAHSLSVHGAIRVTILAFAAWSAGCNQKAAPTFVSTPSRPPATGMDEPIDDEPTTFAPKSARADRSTPPRPPPPPSPSPPPPPPYLPSSLASTGAGLSKPSSPPWIGSDFADPFILREGDVYYAVATSARGEHIQAAVSSDLATWKPLPDALPDLPAWASVDPGLTWAPSVLKRQGKYVLYYTAPDRRSGFQCVSRAVADAPSGPYVDTSSAPFICQVSGADALCGSIDPSPFVDHDGTAYLYWKSDENAASCNTPPRVWVQRLTADGLALEGTPSALLQMDQSWEAPIVEGPAMLLHGDTYFLFYSANWYNSAQYAVGYATCDSPSGPCRKVTRELPWLKTSGTVVGPGGQEFFGDAEGRRYVAYHSWLGATNYEEGGARSLRIQPLAFVDSLPVVEEAPLPRRDNDQAIRPSARSVVEQVRGDVRPTAIEPIVSHCSQTD